VIPAESYSNSVVIERDLVYATYLVASLAVAAATYHIVEMPAQRFLRKRGQSMRWLKPPARVHARTD
jgi:peptidoglycan/LPS O-acetylase OafA/YrhL